MNSGFKIGEKVMNKLKFLIILSLFVSLVKPVQAGDFWRDAKRNVSNFVWQNSGKIGMVFAVSAAIYCLVQDDDLKDTKKSQITKKPVVPVREPKSKLLDAQISKNAYRKARQKVSHRLGRTILLEEDSKS